MVYEIHNPTSVTRVGEITHDIQAYILIHCVPKKTRDHIFDDKLK